MGKPAKEIRCGQVKLVAWSGQYGLSYQVSKSYKKKDTGQWENTNYLNDKDLRDLYCLLTSIMPGLVKNKPTGQRQHSANQQPTYQAQPQPQNDGQQEFEDDIPF